MSDFLKGYIAGFFTVPFILFRLGVAWIFTFGTMGGNHFRKRK